MDDAHPDGDRHGLRAVLRPELLEDPLEMCLDGVRRDPRSLATNLVVAPSATFWRISRSRFDSGVDLGPPLSARWTSSMNVFVSCGWITALPSTALRAASTRASGEASFKRYPETPAWIASEIAPRDSSMVIRITRVSGAASRMRRVASMPSIPGIRTSMKTTSGESSLAATTASSPLAASPTTKTASSDIASAVRRPSRVTG